MSASDGERPREPAPRVDGGATVAANIWWREAPSDFRMWRTEAGMKPAETVPI